jgi:flagellar FliJ protein
MKRFQFTLQALLTLRQQQEQEAMTRYSEALLERSQAMERMRDVEHQLAEARHEWMREAQVGFSAEKALQFQRYELTLIERRKTCATAVSMAERKVNQALHAMMLARQNREAVDKFHQRQRDAHDRSIAREEQKLLDELATTMRGSLLASKFEINL